MGERVLATPAAVRAVEKMQALLSNGPSRQVREVLLAVRSLSSPALWDGPEARTYRQQATRHETDLTRALQTLQQVERHVDQVVHDIVRAGSGTPAGSPAAVTPAVQQFTFTGGSGARYSAVATSVVGDGQQSDPVGDADAMKQALDRGDLATVEQLLDQLPDDPAYLSSYYKELGPAETLKLAELVRSDPNRLNELDRTLAEATNDPSWDPSFDTAIWSSYDQNALPQSPAVLLLGTGTYSEDFLTKAGDAILLTPLATGSTGPFGSPNPQVEDNDAAARAAVLGALARNPQAAGDYLTGTEPGGSTNRLTTVLMRNGPLSSRYSDIGFMLGNTISAAGHSDHYTALLQDLATVPNQNIPDNSRYGIAQVLADHITDFQNAPPSRDGSWSWQATDFSRAEVTDDGHVIQDNLTTIHTSIVQNMAMPPAGASEHDWQQWCQNYGTVNGLSSLALKQAEYTRADQTQFVNSAFGAAFNFIPVGGGNVVSGIVNNAASAAFSKAYPGETLDQASSAATQQYWTQVGQMRTDMATQFLLQNPDLAQGEPGSQAFMDQVQHIAGETVTSTDDPPQVQSFVGRENEADSFFQEQYSLPAPQ